MNTSGNKCANQSSYELEPFFELSPDLLCIAGFDGYFKKINPAVSDLLEYTEEELFSRPINEFVHPEDQAITEKHRNNLRNDVPLLNFENRYVKKNGEIVWLAWTSIPLPEEKLVYAIAKNVTPKKQIEKDRNALIADLTKINKNLKQLTYTTSHDLRSPVSSLVAASDLLDVSKIQDKQTLKFIEILKTSTQNLKETLNKYMEELKQKESLNISTEQVNLFATLDKIRQSIHSLIEDSAASFEVNFSAFDHILFNRAYMESIFLNLISNSIKYARPEIPPVISIRTKIDDGRKQLIFSDNGLGFDMERVGNRIFGLHQKFHHHSSSKGVGLYLVYNHVTSLGGQIGVDSEINKGTIFTITFRE